MLSSIIFEDFFVVPCKREIIFSVFSSAISVSFYINVFDSNQLFIFKWTLLRRKCSKTERPISKLEYVSRV